MQGNGFLKNLVFRIQTAPYKLKQKRQRAGYRKWIREHEGSRKIETLPYHPLISVIVPVYNGNEHQLRECIESVRRQSYQNWELCLADDASPEPHVQKVLKEYEGIKKIQIMYREKNGHISRATNSALKMASGEFVAFLDCDDILADHALYETVKLLNARRDLDFIYSDEDKVDKEGKNRHEPHFKPEWSPDTLMSMMYTSHLGVYRRSVIEEAGGLRTGYEGSQDYDLTLRITEKTSRIGHIPEVLYHWRESDGSTSGNLKAKPYIFDAQKKAKQDALKRRGLSGRLEMVEDVMQYRVCYDVPEGKKMLVILLGGDKGRSPEIWDGCMEKSNGLLELEIVAADQSEAAELACHTDADLLCFLDSSLRVPGTESLERMAGHALLSHVGAVGAKILCRNGHTIFHCGIRDDGSEGEWVLQGMDDRVAYDFGKNRLDFNYDVVSGGCLVLMREKYLQAAGKSSPDDMELCRRLKKSGYHNVLRNDAVFVQGV